MKYKTGDILRYPKNGITWRVIDILDIGIVVELLNKGTSNHPYKPGSKHIYPISQWRTFNIISFRSYLNKL